MWTLEQSRRMNIMTGIIVAIIVFLIARLAWMQLLNGAQYKKIAEDNRIRQITAPAPRGNIYDRNGALLVSNRPSFVVDQMVMAKIQEHKYYLPGVIIEAVPVRHYVYKDLAAHIVGFIGSINKTEYIQRKEQGYNPNDIIGKDGLEREWEEMLRGVDGGLQVEVNALGEEIQIIGDKPAMAGNGLVLTLDVNLQKIVQDALAAQIVFSRTIGQPAKGGSAVVLDVRTGAVLAMASDPGFDPNLFASGEIVVSVLVEEGGDGSVSEAPVVRKILEGYFAARK